MTIAISLKINDGLVLASDSASTLLGLNPTAGKVGVFNVYNNADKVFNLKKGLPIGAITWGAGSIGQSSTSTILKDLRKIFTDGDDRFPGWKLDKRAYTIEQTASRLKEFVYDGLYLPAFRDAPQKPDLGFIVAGYSANASMAEEFQIDIRGGACAGPRPLRSKEQIGITWGGNAEPLNRLILGISGGLPQVLQNLFRASPQQMPSILQNIQQNLQAPIVVPAMPLQDAIEVAEFLVDVTIKFSRFMPGAPTVGGPIDIAAISKHEGFRWIRRKYYFERKLNPEELFLPTYEPGREGKPEPDSA
ncbi:MAG: hypothetical protein WCA44_12315 [Acidobacteriaceae bacterium]